MSETNVLIPIGKKEYIGTIICVECGKEVKRTNGSHIRCDKCRAEHKNNYRQKDFERRFPVFYEPLRWFVEYLNGERDSDDLEMRREQNKEHKKRARRVAGLVKAVDGPTPCKGCRYYDSCAEGNMCKSFYVWSDESNLDVKVWGKRNNPCGRYYWRSFPRDIKPETMRRVK
jgi:hypothetical protein